MSWRQMVAVAGVLAVSGTTVVLLLHKPGVTNVELAGGGINDELDPVLLSCAFLVEEHCRDLPDGGTRPRYLRAKLKGMYGQAGTTKTLADGGTRYRERDVLVLRVPIRDGQPCFRPVGGEHEACSFVAPPDAGCADEEACGDGADPQPEQNQCACRETGQNCRRVLPDGGLGANWPFGVTIPPGQWGGAGCKRKFCGPELYGAPGTSWPSECQE